MSRLNDEAREARDQLELAQALLLTCASDLDEVALRIGQALRRTALVHGVLGPALERLEGVRGDVRLAREALGQAYQENRRGGGHGRSGAR